MGKRLNSIRNWFDTQLAKVTNLSDMDKVKLAIDQLKAKQKEIDDTYYTALGERDYTKQEVTNATRVLEEIESAAKTCATQGDDANLQKLFSHKTSVEKTLELQKQTLGVQDKVVSQLFQVRIATKAKLEEVTQLKSQLEIKDNFAKTVEKYKSFTVAGTDLSIDEALKGIEVKYSAADYQFDDLAKDVSVEELLQSQKQTGAFENWKSTL